jgi:hypothetical protein
MDAKGVTTVNITDPPITGNTASIMEMTRHHGTKTALIYVSLE